MINIIRMLVFGGLYGGSPYVGKLPCCLCHHAVHFTCAVRVQGADVGPITPSICARQGG